MKLRFEDLFVVVFLRDGHGSDLGRVQLDPDPNPIFLFDPDSDPDPILDLVVSVGPTLNR